jgi:putative membrane protein
MADNSPAAGQSSGATTEMVDNDAGTELASNRTSLSFERTRMAADRTLMAIVRTSLSLISFGFTIYKAFEALKESPVTHLEGAHAARYFGVSLLYLGVGLLILGILSQWKFNRELTQRRERLYGLHLLRRTIQYSATPTFIVAVVLLLIGFAAMAAVAFRL